MLIADKYAPRKFSDLTIHPALNERLQKIETANELENTLIYGPTGGGRKTRVMALLRKIYGKGALQTKYQKYAFKHSVIKLVNGKRRRVTTNYEVPLISSNYHFECTPSDMGTKDHILVQEVIRLAAESGTCGGMLPPYPPASSSSTSSSITSLQGDMGGASPQPKIIIFNEVDKMSKKAQHALRRMMEKYTHTCRFICIAENISRVIGPIQSRLAKIRVPAPTKEEIINLLTSIIEQEGMTDLLDWTVPIEIANDCDRNLRKALLLLSGVILSSSKSGANITPQSLIPPLSSSSQQISREGPRGQELGSGVGSPPLLDQYMDEMAANIIAEQVPKQFIVVQTGLYHLLSSGIPPEIIFKKLVKSLLAKVGADEMQHRIIQQAAHYQHLMILGSKPIFYLEAFVTGFMVDYQKYIQDLFS